MHLKQSAILSEKAGDALQFDVYMFEKGIDDLRFFGNNNVAPAVVTAFLAKRYVNIKCKVFVRRRGAPKKGFPVVSLTKGGTPLGYGGVTRITGSGPVVFLKEIGVYVWCGIHFGRSLVLTSRRVSKKDAPMLCTVRVRREV